MFLDQDERLLLFHHRQGPLALDMLKGFGDAGVKTVKHAARQISWHEIEPEPGVYNWSEVDKAIELSHKAGLKVLLDVYWRAPDWVNAKQEFHRSPGTSFIDPDGVFDASWLAIDPFDETAMGQEEEFLHKICSRYSTSETMCCYAMPHSGERILPFWLPVQYTEEQCVDIVLKRQRVFAQYYDELWSAFHPLSWIAKFESVDGSTKPHHGTEHWEAAHKAILKEFPEHTLNHFITVFFLHAPYKIHQWDRHRTWTGAQFTKGVVSNSRKVDKHGIYGLVMASSGVNPQYQFGDPGKEEFERTREAIGILKR